ncbi:MAG TPA: hypothetical protein VKA43_06920 [Gammaproteobacteria bacterium]|nr:hypothetical protein [Gammaproteobacteria bacterium]
MRLRRLSFFLPGLAMLLATAVVEAQNAPALAGRWEGVLIPKTSRGSRDLTRRAEPIRLPTVVVITTAGDGTYSGTWASTSQNGITPIGKVTIEDETINIRVPAWAGTWEGKLSADGSTLEGKWRQNGLQSPLVLTRVATQ